MTSKESSKKTDLPKENPDIKLRILKTPLSQDDLASRSYADYLGKLDKARQKEMEEEESGNTSGQIKS